MTDGTVRQIAALPEDWHGAGTVSAAVLDALQRHACARGNIARSVETGTGKTTLLLSHLSRDQTVFTKNDTGDGDSLDRVRYSPLLCVDKVTFVVGPTQRTVLGHRLTGRSSWRTSTVRTRNRSRGFSSTGRSTRTSPREGCS